VDFGGKPQIAHIVERLRGLGDEFVVSIGRNGAVLAAKAEYAAPLDIGHSSSDQPRWLDNDKVDSFRSHGGELP
jgi:hypothetical protein